VTRLALLLVRAVLPAAIAAAGAVLIIAGEGENADGAGVALIGCAILVVMFNVFIRIGVRDQRDRADEEAAREEFKRTGRWPDEEER